MRVLDVFSNLPAIELSIEQIEDIFLKSCEGVIDDTYTVNQGRVSSLRL